MRKARFNNHELCNHEELAAHNAKQAAWAAKFRAEQEVSAAHRVPPAAPPRAPVPRPPSVPATIWPAAHTTAHVGSPSRPSSYLLRRAARRDSPRQKKAEERKQGNARRRLKKVMHGVAAAQHLKMIAEAAGFDKHKQFTWPADAWAWAAERRSGDRSLLL